MGVGVVYSLAFGEQPATAEHLAECAAALRARATALAAMTASERAAAIERIGRAWTCVDQMWAPTEAAYHPNMLRWGFRETCGRWTQDALLDLYRAELGPHAGRDLPVAPELCGVVLASTIPPAGLEAIVLVLLLGSPVLVRPARALAGLARRFVESLAELAPELASCVAVADFPPDEASMRAFAAGCDALVVHGGVDAVDAWRHHAPARAIAYGHRLSAAFLGRAALAEPSVDAALCGLAEDFCAWEQTGCLSPHVLFVEQPAGTGTVSQLHELARRLLVHVEATEQRLPPLPLSLQEETRRSNYVRSLLFEATVLSSPAGAHLVVYDEPGPLRPVESRRVLIVRPVRGLEDLVARCSAAAPYLQALAVAGVGDTRALARRLAPAGLNRLCAPGAMQRPPLWWRHDGIGSLAPLVRWVSLG